MRKLGLTTSLCVALIFAITNVSSSTAQISDDTIKIGVMADMNGPLSTAGGRGSVEAARMAAEEFGGLIAGKHIEIVSADHQNKPDIGAAIARQWFNVEHVDVITDLANSAVGFAVVEVAKPLNKIVLVSGPGSSDFTGKACAPTSIHWTWDTYGAATTTARAIVGPDANTWFFIASDYAFGRALEGRRSGRSHRPQIQAGTYSAVRHYLQAVKDLGTDEPLAVLAKMRATPVNDIFATGGYIREDGRMVHDMYFVQIKAPAESKGPWDLVKIIKTVPGDEAFRPLSESECPLLKKKS